MLSRRSFILTRMLANPVKMNKNILYSFDNLLSGGLQKLYLPSRGYVKHLILSAKSWDTGADSESMWRSTLHWFWKVCFGVKCFHFLEIKCLLCFTRCFAKQRHHRKKNIFHSKQCNFLTTEHFRFFRNFRC